MTRSVAFKTLGCRLNQYETDAIESDFRRAGYRVTAFDEPADAYVINSCTVTGQSDQKSRNLMNRAGRNGDDSVVVITGCMANHYRDELEGRHPVTYVVENDRKSAIFALVDGHFKGEILHPRHLPADPFGYRVADRSVRTRHMVKIQDGCNNFCTFCIIPKVRGRAVSRPLDAVLDNVREVLDRGGREVVLTGVNMGRYAHDGVTFEDLVQNVLELPGDFRVRLSSLEPEGFGDAFFALLDHPRMTPHLHLCLQSGSDRILRRMRRMYSVKQFLDIADRARARHARFNVTTDMLVGFPGETDEDFEASLDVARLVGFSHIHTFKYSVRQGTRAAGMAEPVAENVKSERSEKVRAVCAENRRRYYERLVGMRQRVLVERVEQGCASGYGELYVPVEFPSSGAAAGRMWDVRLTGLTEDPVPSLRAEPLPD